MLKVKHVGSGKSLIGKYSEKIGYRIRVPQNMLKEEVECDAETLNACLNVPVFKDYSLASYD